jgi:hypothetical protein
MVHGVQKLKSRHEHIINWLVANPHRAVAQAAQELGYTPTWLYQIIGSDVFQAAYRQRCREVGAIASHTVTNKLTHLALAAIDRQTERIEAGTMSERGTAEALDTALEALEYTGKATQAGPANQVNLSVVVASDELVAARQRTAAARRGTSPAKQIEVSPEHRSIPGNTDFDSRVGDAAHPDADASGTHSADPHSPELEACWP